MGFCLLLMPFMPNLWTTVVIVMSFFFAYYLYETPYRGLYPDVLPPELFGRSQGIQHILRGIALGIALVGGGLLFKLWRPSPFILAAILTTTACGLDDPAGARGRRPRAGLRGLPGLHPAELAHLLGGRRRAALSARELGVGGCVRGGEDVRRALRDRRAAPVEGAVVGGAGGGRRRLRDRGDLRRAAGRPLRARARDLLRLVHLRRRLRRRPASRSSGTTGTSG